MRTLYNTSRLNTTGQVGRLFRVFRVITHMSNLYDQLPLKYENPALPALPPYVALYILPANARFCPSAPGILNKRYKRYTIASPV